MRTRTLATLALSAGLLAMGVAAPALADGYDVANSSGTVRNAPPPPPPPPRPAAVAAVRG